MVTVKKSGTTKSTPKSKTPSKTTPKSANKKAAAAKSTPKASPKVAKKAVASPKSTTPKSEDAKAASSKSTTPKSKAAKIASPKSAAASKPPKEVAEPVAEAKEKANVEDGVTTPAKTKASKKAATPQKSTTNNSASSTPAKSTPKRKAATATASPAKKTKTGDSTDTAQENPIPEDMIIKDHTGANVNLYELSKDSGIVIFAYPAASTPGCTKQVCFFRDSYQTFIDKGYKVFGLSNDPCKKNLSFYTKQKLNYSLLSDPEAKLIKFLGANNGNANKAIRSAFVIVKGGKMIYSKINVGPEPSKDWVLKIIS